MAYSKAKLKSIGDRASPCFKPFLIGNLSDTFLPTRTLLYVSVRLIFINLTSFLGTPNSMRFLYKTSLLAYIYIYIYIYIFPVALRHNAGHSLLLLNFPDHTQRRTIVSRTPLAEWSALRRDLYLNTHTKLTREKHPFPRRDSNPQSQQTSGLRPTP